VEVIEMSEQILSQENQQLIDAAIRFIVANTKITPNNELDFRQIIEGLFQVKAEFIHKE